MQTFTGVAQMLESTFFATHSSFFAMVGVIEQFGQLRDALGSVLGLFGLVRWLRDRLVGQRSQPEMGTEFREFVGSGGAKPPARVDSAPRPSKKPLIIFLLAVFGLPYAMMRIARALRERQQALAPNPSGAALPAPQRVLDPSTLRFARALYAFEPTSPSELGLKENEIVAIMGKLDPTTGVEVDPNAPLESEWWRGRTRDGREGWFPRKWVEVLEKKEPKKVQ